MKLFAIAILSISLWSCSNRDSVEKSSTAAEVKSAKNYDTVTPPSTTKKSDVVIKSNNVVQSLGKSCQSENDSNEDYSCYKFDLDGDGEDDTIRLSKPAQYSHTTDIPDMGLDGDTSIFPLDYKQGAIIIMLTSSPQIFGINANDMSNISIVNNSNKKAFENNFNHCLIEGYANSKIVAYNKKNAVIVRVDGDTNGLVAYRCSKP